MKITQLNKSEILAILIIYIMIILAFLYGENYGIRPTYVAAIGLIITISLFSFIRKEKRN